MTATTTSTHPQEDRLPSPCIGVCKIGEDGLYCEGCLRTRGEIREWKKAEREDQLEILDRLRERRAALGLKKRRRSRVNRRRTAK